MAQTRALIAKHLPKELTNAVMKLFSSSDRSLYKIAKYGEWEACIEIGYNSESLRGACFGLHVELVEYLINLNTLTGEDDLNAILTLMITLNKIKKIRHLVEYNIFTPEQCLAQGWNEDVVKIGLEFGAKNFQQGLDMAEYRFKQESISLILEYAAIEFVNGKLDKLYFGRYDIHVLWRKAINARLRYVKIQEGQKRNATYCKKSNENLVLLKKPRKKRIQHCKYCGFPKTLHLNRRNRRKFEECKFNSKCNLKDIGIL